MKKILETERVYLREMEPGDIVTIRKMLQDPEVMEHYSHDFSEEDIQEWLDRQLRRYAQHGFGHWAACLKDGDEMIGQCGIALQDADGRQVPEIGYLLLKEHWHKGYAAEMAIACRDYAFNTLSFEEVYSLIRDTNAASQKVAVRNGMRYRFGYVEHFYGNDINTMAYSVMKSELAETPPQG